MRITRLVAAAIPAAFVASPALGAFVAPTQWNRGDAGTTYQEWDVFTSPAGPNDPDVANQNPHWAASGDSDVYDTSGGSFVTSGGNIYSFSVPGQIDVLIPDSGLGASHYTTVVFQLRTQGTEADYSSIRLTYNDGTDEHTLSPVDSAELFREGLGGFGGALVDAWFEFHIPYSPASYLIEFEALSSSMSLDCIAVDSITTTAALGFVNEPNPVPEPASLALLATGTVLAASRRRTARA